MMTNFFKKIDNAGDNLRNADKEYRDAIMRTIHRLMTALNKEYIVFNDYTAYPMYIDDTTGDYEELKAVNVKWNDKAGKYELYGTSSEDIEDKREWFMVELFGSLNYDTLVESLKKYASADALPQPKKKAVLVTANVTTRVLIDNDGEGCLTPNEWESAVVIAKARLLSNLSNDYLDCVEDVRTDTDCPYEEGE
jgi:hypothetical protein